MKGIGIDYVEMLTNRIARLEDKVAAIELDKMVPIMCSAVGPLKYGGTRYACTEAEMHVGSHVSTHPDHSVCWNREVYFPHD